MKKHFIIWLISIGLALWLGWMDHETESWSMLLYNRGNIITLLFITLVFAGLGYSIRRLCGIK
jgi:fumarate reductase subunit D